ncbi:MAG: hypothetical protein O2930_16005 [Acidobacteria bacterium]|nr:hypothetical protein [Acidobacteriota bacterium]
MIVVARRGWRSHTAVASTSRPNSGYADLNDSDYQADILLPANVTQTIDGQTAYELTIERTNTYNPYVIMPVPDSVRAAAQ